MRVGPDYNADGNGVKTGPDSRIAVVFPEWPRLVE